MLENIIFALNTTLPLFILMAVGFFLRKINNVKPEFIKAANNFNFSVTIPVMLFLDMATADFKETFDLKFLLFCAVSTTVGILAIWGVARLIIKNPGSRAELVQACYRGSLAVNGMALVVSIYGQVGMAGMMILGSVPLFNIFAVIILQAESPDRVKTEGEHALRKALIGIAKNPIIIAVIGGFLFSLTGIKFPQFIDSSLSYIGRIGTPLALICIGADFDFKAAFANISKSAYASFHKLLLHPLIFVAAAVLLGFRGEKLVSILIMVASPTTPVAFVMAKKYGHEGIITSSTVALTTLLSSFTLALFIFGLRQLGLM